MGSMVHLALGPFEVDWGKNNSLRLHGEIYQPGDVTSVPDVYVGEDNQRFTKLQTGTSKPLAKVLPRLELLGYTLEAARAEFDSLIDAFARGELDDGWVQPETISNSIGDVRRFLIVTEGSSDAHIIRRAFELLRPEIADFFSFVDMQEGYPFTGTGNLHKFSQGLVAIGIENRVIVLYDNDLEGSLRFRDTSGLNLPAMRVIHLPSLPQLAQFRSVGPHGEAMADINGRAAAIECYLDLAFGRGRKDPEPAVRWTAYNERAEAYQGVLEFKQKYAKRFLNLRTRDSNYDFSRLEAVLEHIVASCVSMAAAGKLTESGLELERRL